MKRGSEGLHPSQSSSPPLSGLQLKSALYSKVDKMTTDHDAPPPPYTPNDPLTPTSSQFSPSPFQPNYGPDHLVPVYRLNSIEPDQGLPAVQSQLLPMSPTFSSAVPYFESREPQVQATNPPTSIATHTIFITPTDITHNLNLSTIPLCWRNTSTSLDLTPTDLSTFANYLLPPAASSHAAFRIRASSKKDEKQPLSPTDGETQPERESRIAQVVAEWNEAFFLPRGLRAEVRFIPVRPPYMARGLEPICEACVIANGTRPRYVAHEGGTEVEVPVFASQPPATYEASPPYSSGPFQALRSAAERRHEWSARIHGHVRHHRCGERGRGRGRDPFGGRRRRSVSSSSSSDSSRSRSRSGRGGRNGRGGFGAPNRRCRNGNKHWRKRRSSSSSSFSCDPDSDFHQGHHEGTAESRRNRNHTGRERTRGRSHSTSTSPSTASSRSPSKASYRSFDDSGINPNIFRALASLQNEAQNAKYEAKVTIAQLKRDLHAKKAEMMREGGREEWARHKRREKMNAKMQMRSIKTTLHEALGVLKKEMKGLKGDMKEDCKGNKEEWKNKRNAEWAAKKHEWERFKREWDTWKQERKRGSQDWERRNK